MSPPDARIIPFPRRHPDTDEEVPFPEWRRIEVTALLVDMQRTLLVCDEADFEGYAAAYIQRMSAWSDG